MFIFIIPEKEILYGTFALCRWVWCFTQDKREFFSIFGGQCHSFDIYFISQIGIETSKFAHSNFAWGLHGGVDFKWSGGSLVLKLH